MHNHMNTTKQEQSKNMLMLLQEVKFELKNLLASRLKGQKHSWQIKTYFTKFNKKCQMQKQNQILTYQLGLLLNLIHYLDIDKQSQIFILNKNIFNNQIELKQQIRQKQLQIQRLLKKFNKLNEQKEQYSTKQSKFIKNMQIYEKKINCLQANGGTTKINQLQAFNKQLQCKYSTINKQNEKLKQQIIKLQNKCKILEQLNRQTQNKVSEYLVLQKNNKHIEKQNENDENLFSQKKQYSQYDKNARIQLMAAKAEIKSLKAKISQLKKQQNSKKQITLQKQKNSNYKQSIKKLRN